MSAILENVLDAERLAACRLHDAEREAWTAQQFGTVSTARIPTKPIKAPMDLMGEILAHARGHRRAYVPQGGRVEYFDDTAAPSIEPIREEVERLQGCEYDLGEIVPAAREVLAWLTATPEGYGTVPPEAVEKLRAALAGVAHV